MRTDFYLMFAPLKNDVLTGSIPTFRLILVIVGLQTKYGINGHFLNAVVAQYPSHKLKKNIEPKGLPS